jgi:hypothetical protein
MRWAPLHPRQLMAIAAATLMTIVMLMLFAAQDLGPLNFSLGGDSTGSAGSTVSIPQSVEATETSPPVWVTDPLASPLGHFR